MIARSQPLLVGLPALLAAGCNLTPTPYPDPSRSPRGAAPYSHPTDVACDRRDDPITFEVDGFTFCGQLAAQNKIPVDDPLFVQCDTVARSVGPVVVLFDGAMARGYSVLDLNARELVNDWWGDEPILVDY